MKRIAETRKKSKSFLIGINEKCQPVSGKSRPSYGGDGDDIKFGNDLKWQKMPFTLKTKRILISHSSSSTPVFFRCVKHLYKRVCPCVRGFVPHVENPTRGASDGQYWLLLRFQKIRVTDGWTDGPTDRRTNRRMDGRMDRPSYRDARTHLKDKIKTKKGLAGETDWQKEGSMDRPTQTYLKIEKWTLFGM